MKYRNQLEATGIHVARYGLVLVLLWIGGMKFTTYEAEGIEPLVTNSPFMGWVYNIMSIRGFAALAGCGRDHHGGHDRSAAGRAADLSRGERLGGGDVPYNAQLPLHDAGLGTGAWVSCSFCGPGSVHPQRCRVARRCVMDGWGGVGSVQGGARRSDRLTKAFTNEARTSAERNGSQRLENLQRERHELAGRLENVKRARSGQEYRELRERVDRAEKERHEIAHKLHHELVELRRFVNEHLERGE